MEVIHKNFSLTENLDMCIHYQLFRMEVNPLAAELSAQCNVQKTGDLNGHPLFRMILANDRVAFGLLGTTPCIDYSQLLAPEGKSSITPSLYLKS